jgi:hypothetical protein
MPDKRLPTVSIYYPLGNTKRLEYAAWNTFILRLGIEYSILSDKTAFLKKSGVCINYSNEDLNHGLQILPHGLLSESGVRKIPDLEESEWQGFFCFFKQEKGDIPFDLFSASFYLLTLYEEYGSEKIDEHGRFDYQESLAFRKGFLEIPIVDRWVDCLGLELTKKYPGFVFRRKQIFSCINTFDVDFPYLYRKKGLIKIVGASIRDLWKSDFKNLASRFKTLLHFEPDPYWEALRQIHEIQTKAGKNYLLFVMMGGKDKYGMNTFRPGKSYFAYLKNSRRVTVGLHPSYDTFLNPDLLMTEKKRLQNIWEGNEISSSRQHYLRMRIPDTFRELRKAGLTNDYTLAYAKAPGFRSGTAISYRFYDVEKEEESEIILHPTVVMDSTLITHLQLSPEEAIVKLKKMIEECYQSAGKYISVWHNSNLDGNEEENPWINVFMTSFKYAISLENNNFVKK